MSLPSDLVLYSLAQYNVGDNDNNGSSPWTPEHDQANECKVIFLMVLGFLVIMLAFIAYNVR